MTADQQLNSGKSNDHSTEFWGNSESDEQRSVIERPYQPRNDAFLYRTAVITLAGIAIVCILGTMILTFYDKKLPESLVSLASVAVGALAVLVKLGH